MTVTGTEIFIVSNFIQELFKISMIEGLSLLLQESIFIIKLLKSLEVFSALVI